MRVGSLLPPPECPKTNTDTAPALPIISQSTCIHHADMVATNALKSIWIKQGSIEMDMDNGMSSETTSTMSSNNAGSNSGQDDDGNASENEMDNDNNDNDNNRISNSQPTGSTNDKDSNLKGTRATYKDGISADAMVTAGLPTPTKMVATAYTTPAYSIMMSTNKMTTTMTMTILPVNEGSSGNMSTNSGPTVGGGNYGTNSTTPATTVGDTTCL